MDKLYIIVGTWSTLASEMAHFYTPDKAVQYISENARDSFPNYKKADPTDDPKDYLNEYDDYCYKKDYDPEFYMKLHIIDLKKEKKSSEVNMLRFMHGVNKNISSEDQYRVFCMFSQLSKEETKGYDCDEMWSYCHDLYSTFCDSGFNDDNISEIDAMNKFLENIEERIAWCEDNPPLTNGQKFRLRIIQNYLDFKSGYGDPDCKPLTDDCLFDYISWDIGRGDSNYIDKDGNDRFPELNNDEFSNVTLLLEDKEVSHG